MPGQEQTASQFVRATQQALKDIGMYGGDVDGLYGPMTRAAIQRFQKAHSLAADGEVTIGLINAIRKQAERGTEGTSGSIQAIASSRTDPANVKAEPASLVQTSDAPIQSAAEITRAAKVARIQIGLMNFGEGGISVDGVLGPQTVAAIRAFQRRYHLPETGEPDDAVIDKLEQIGALKKS